MESIIRKTGSVHKHYSFVLPGVTSKITKVANTEYYSTFSSRSLRISNHLLTADFFRYMSKQEHRIA